MACVTSSTDPVRNSNVCDVENQAAKPPGRNDPTRRALVAVASRLILVNMATLLIDYELELDWWCSTVIVPSRTSQSIDKITSFVPYFLFLKNKEGLARADIDGRVPAVVPVESGNHH